MDKVYDEEIISDWIREKVSDYSQISYDEIETDVNLSETYGLSSVDAISLIGELEEWLGDPISPSVLFEYASIDDLADHLAVRDGKARQFLYRLHLYLNQQ